MLSCKCQKCGTEYLYSKRVLGACLRCFSRNIEVGKNYNIPAEKLGKSDLDRDGFLYNIKLILRTGDFTPNDIVEQTKIVECVKLYIPYYSYEVSYHCAYSCLVGNDKLVDYTDYKTKTDNDGKEYKVPVHRQRTETDWKPFSSEKDGKRKIYHSASSKFYDVHDFIKEVSKCKKVYVDSNDIPEDIVIEKIEISANKVFKERCESNLKNHISFKIEGTKLGDDVKDFIISSIDYSIDSSDLKFEVIWIALCDYKGHTFVILSDANNSDVNRVIKKPVDQERINLLEKKDQETKILLEKIERETKESIDIIKQEMNESIEIIDQDKEESNGKIKSRIDKLKLINFISLTAVIFSFIMLMFAKQIVMELIIIIIICIPLYIFFWRRKKVLERKHDEIKEEFEEKRASIKDEYNEKRTSIIDEYKEKRTSIIDEYNEKRASIKSGT